MDKILTVSIAAYNAEMDISRCLDSLIASDVIEYLDVIVVNDGSMDKTSEVAGRYTQKYGDSIRLINKQNGGHGSTINMSIKYAIGKYYKILDSDDWVEPRNLKKLVDFLSGSDVDLVLNPYHEVSYGDHTKRKLLSPNGVGLDYEKTYNIKDVDSRITLFMHSLTYRTECVKKMNSAIDENCFYVDMEYCIFPLIYVEDIVCLEYPVYEYLLGSQTQSMNIINMIKRREQHLKVTRRIIEFWNAYELHMKTSIREMISIRIKYAVYQQYKIYLCMSSSEAIHEIKSFDRWLKDQSIELYRGPEGRQMRLIELMRKTRFRFYRPMAYVAKMFYMSSMKMSGGLNEEHL